MFGLELRLGLGLISVLLLFTLFCTSAFSLFSHLNLSILLHQWGTCKMWGSHAGAGAGKVRRSKMRRIQCKAKVQRNIYKVWIAGTTQLYA